MHSDFDLPWSQVLDNLEKKALTITAQQTAKF